MSKENPAVNLVISYLVKMIVVAALASTLSSYLLGTNVFNINNIFIGIISTLILFILYHFYIYFLRMLITMAFFQIRMLKTITSFPIYLLKIIILNFENFYLNIRRTIFFVGLVSKKILAITGKRKQINNSLPKETSFNSFIDSYCIDCIYALILSILGGLILFISTSVSMNLGILVTILYYIIEVCWLYYGERTIESIPDGKIEGFGSWCSWPTLGIILSSPFLLAYFLIRIRDLNYISSSGLLKIWVISRYLITHPKLPEFNRKDDKTLRKLMRSNLCSDTHLTIKVFDPAKANS